MRQAISFQSVAAERKGESSRDDGNRAGWLGGGGTCVAVGRALGRNEGLQRQAAGLRGAGSSSLTGALPAPRIVA